MNHSFQSTKKLILLIWCFKRYNKNIRNNIKWGACHQTERMTVNEFVTDYAKKIFVHNTEAKRMLMEKNIGRSVCNMSYIKFETETTEDLSTVVKNMLVL